MYLEYTLAFKCDSTHHEVRINAVACLAGRISLHISFSGRVLASFSEGLAFRIVRIESRIRVQVVRSDLQALYSWRRGPRGLRLPSPPNYGYPGEGRVPASLPSCYSYKQL